VNIPWWSRLIGVILQILFLIAQCIVRFFIALLEVIKNFLSIVWPFLVGLIIALVATYLFQIFAPPVLDFIMNALIPFINVIIDLWCFISYVAILIYRIVSMIWNMFVPMIGFILYVVVLIIVDVFLAILMLILDILFDILSLLLEIIIALVMLVIQILIVFITIQVELLLVLVQIIFPILMVVFEVITALLDIVVWILTVLFWVLEPILDALAALVGGRSKRSFIPPATPSEDALLHTVFGPGFSDATRTSADIPASERAFLDSLSHLQQTQDIGSIRARYTAIRNRLDPLTASNPILSAALYAPDPGSAITDLFSDRSVRPFSHADIVHAMTYMGMGPNITDPSDPAYIQWETNAIVQMEENLRAEVHRERVKRSTIPSRMHAGDPHYHVKRAYHAHSAARRTRVAQRLSTAFDAVKPTFLDKYWRFRQEHATDERIGNALDRAWEHGKNRTGWHTHHHFLDHAHGALSSARESLTFHSYEHFLHTISPSHSSWHQWLQTLDPDRHSRRFWNRYIAEEGEPDWKERERERVRRSNATLSTTRRLQEMELSVLYDNDCFSSEERNFLCLPEVPSNFTLCPAKLCSPFDLNNGTCTQFGYIDTNCVLCPARFKNAWVVIGYLLSLTFIIPLAVRTLANVVAIPFLSDLILFIGPDDTISVQGILCTLIHLYDLLIIFATFLFFYLFVLPFISAFIDCVRHWIEAWEDDRAYDAAWIGRDEEGRALEREIRNYLTVEAARRGGRTYWIDGPEGTFSRPMGLPAPSGGGGRSRDPSVDPVFQRYGVSSEQLQRELSQLPVSIGELIGTHIDTLNASRESRERVVKPGKSWLIGARVVDLESPPTDSAGETDDSMRALCDLTHQDVAHLMEYNAYRARVFMTRLNHFFGLEESDYRNADGCRLSRDEMADLERMNMEDWQLRLHHMRTWREEVNRHLERRL